jgi:hypothetical protein
MKSSGMKKRIARDAAMKRHGQMPVILINPHIVSHLRTCAKIITKMLIVISAINNQVELCRPERKGSVKLSGENNL